MQDWDKLLKKEFPEGAVQHNYPLRLKTTFRIGGPAQWCVTIHQRREMIALIRLCRRMGIPWFLLGGGSNVLFSEEGFRGVVIVTQMDTYEETAPGCLQVAAGLELMQVVRLAEARGLAGFEALAGIPGSVGGAIVGNAGAFGRNIGELLESVEILTEEGEVEQVKPQELGLDYRETRLKYTSEVVLSACFRLALGDPLHINQVIAETLALRAEKHPPHDAATAGSFFKNLPPDKEGGRRIAAGLILDQAGAHSLSVGDAVVYEKHANIIINRNQATAQNVLDLTARMKQLAYDHAGVSLVEEVRRIGFSPTQLAKTEPRKTVPRSDGGKQRTQ
jgi:UDP-N-acetylmuramate dehydrogenase